MTDSAWDILSADSISDRRLVLAWRAGLGFNCAAPPEVLVRLFDVGEADFLFRRDLPPSVMDAAVAHPSRRVQSLAMESGRLSAEQWERLIGATAEPKRCGFLAQFAAEELAVRRFSVGRTGVGGLPHPGAVPPATPDEIASMAAQVPDIDPEHSTSALWWVVALEGDDEAMRRLAASSKLWIRRSVARASRLPEDVAHRLAEDPDRVVRLFLTESCEDAPPQVLLDVWTWWQGSLSFPGRPRNHPNFPRDGLMRFARHPDPHMRLLALDDPGSSAALVEDFSHDDEAEVRRAAAADPRLSPASATRLLDDPDSAVRYLARAHPALRPEDVAGQLLTLAGAEDAARNPAIPLTVMHRMIELAPK